MWLTRIKNPVWFFKRIYKEPFRLSNTIYRTIHHKGSTKNHKKASIKPQRRVVTIAESFFGAKYNFF